MSRSYINEMGEFLDQTKFRMEKAVEIVGNDVATVRTGRIAPSLIENVIVSVYNGASRLKIMELVAVHTSDPRTLVLTPFDPAVKEEIASGIMSANLGFSPIIDGNIIRINIPPLSEERRTELVKLLRQKIEGGRVLIRQIRHEAMTDLRRKFESKEITEDERKRLEKELQHLTDIFIGEIAALGERKEEELLHV